MTEAKDSTADAFAPITRAKKYITEALASMTEAVDKTKGQKDYLNEEN